MILVELFSPTGLPVWINPSAVQAVVPSPDCEGSTLLMFFGGGQFVAKGIAADVAQSIQMQVF